MHVENDEGHQFNCSHVYSTAVKNGLTKYSAVIYLQIFRYPFFGGFLTPPQVFILTHSTDKKNGSCFLKVTAQLYTS
jgi:hypothetical protein